MAELDRIDGAMQRVRDLIRPHTSLNRAGDGLPLFSRDFSVYRDCLQYERDYLCTLLEQDLLFWTQKCEETSNAKVELLSQIKSLEEQTKSADYSPRSSKAIARARKSLSQWQESEHPRHGSIRLTSMRGELEHRGKIDFCWPEESRMGSLARQPPGELSHLILKGQPGRHLQGIGLGFANGVRTPVFERQVYANMVAPALAYELDLEVPYNRIYVKVANKGDNAIITALRIGTSSTITLHHEWKQLGEWQTPIEVYPHEQIVGVRGYFGPADSIKSLGFVLMTITN